MLSPLIHQYKGTLGEDVLRKSPESAFPQLHDIKHKGSTLRHYYRDSK